MKFYIRRAVAGIVSIPFVAGAWVFLYLILLLIGGEPSQTISQTFTNGVSIGIIVAVMFTFAPQFNKFVSFVSGEGK
jgi:ABC-type cobalamin transport system permease subunit